MRAGSGTAQTEDTATATPAAAPSASDTQKADEATPAPAPAPKKKELSADAAEFVPTFAAAPAPMSTPGLTGPPLGNGGYMAPAALNPYLT